MAMTHARSVLPVCGWEIMCNPRTSGAPLSLTTLCGHVRPSDSPSLAGPQIGTAFCCVRLVTTSWTRAGGLGAASHAPRARSRAGLAPTSTAQLLMPEGHRRRPKPACPANLNQVTSSVDPPFRVTQAGRTTSPPCRQLLRTNAPGRARQDSGQWRPGVVRACLTLPALHVRRRIGTRLLRLAPPTCPAVPAWTQVWGSRPTRSTRTRARLRAEKAATTARTRRARTSATQTTTELPATTMAIVWMANFTTRPLTCLAEMGAASNFTSTRFRLRRRARRASPTDTTLPSSAARLRTRSSAMRATPGRGSKKALPQPARSRRQ
mmetsp:Transcript_16652/g.40098  ORF Transcript_16652/g.40098 Transcript_16652/m.40098 type:complete len:322 (-) Transcript_16652:2280-3245(-)